MITAQNSGVEYYLLIEERSTTQDQNQTSNRSSCDSLTIPVLFCRFLAGSTTDLEANKRRDGVVKLIPQISKGPWIVKQAVGTTPCLLGRKLNALYHRYCSVCHIF